MHTFALPRRVAQQPGATRGLLTPVRPSSVFAQTVSRARRRTEPTRPASTPESTSAVSSTTAARRPPRASSRTCLCASCRTRSTRPLHARTRSLRSLAAPWRLWPAHVPPRRGASMTIRLRASTTLALASTSPRRAVRPLRSPRSARRAAPPRLRRRRPRSHTPRTLCCWRLPSAASRPRPRETTPKQDRLMLLTVTTHASAGFLYRRTFDSH